MRFIGEHRFRPADCISIDVDHGAQFFLNNHAVGVLGGISSSQALQGQLADSKSLIPLVCA